MMQINFRCFIYGTIFATSLAVGCCRPPVAVARGKEAI